MKVLSIKAGAFELTRVALLKSPITIGRSPLCDVVIRVQGIKQFHFLLEKSELLTNDIGWDFRDLTREASADSDDSILRFEDNIYQMGNLKFEWLEDRLQSQKILEGGLVQSLAIGDGDQEIGKKSVEVVVLNRDSQRVLRVDYHNFIETGEKLAVFDKDEEVRVGAQDFLGDGRLLIKSEKHEALLRLVVEPKGSRRYVPFIRLITALAILLLFAGGLLLLPKAREVSPIVVVANKDEEPLAERIVQLEVVKPAASENGEMEGAAPEPRDVSKLGLLGYLGDSAIKQKTISASRLVGDGRSPHVDITANSSQVGSVKKSDLTALDESNNNGEAGGPSAASIEGMAKALVNKEQSKLVAVAPSAGTLGSGSTVQPDLGIKGNGGDRDFSVSGGLTRDQVKEAILQHRQEIRFCYEKALIVNKSLAGHLTFSWDIQSNGVVSQISLQKNSIGSPQFEACVAGVIKAIRFPKSSSGRADMITRVIYPFLFNRM